MSKTGEHVQRAIDRSELNRLEAEGEAGYDQMYEAHNYRDAKDAWDQCSVNLYRAIEEAKRLGLTRMPSVYLLGGIIATPCGLASFAALFE
jgi:hypothetical protein